MQTETATQSIALGLGVVPQSLTNARLNSSSIDMQKTRRALFVLTIGATTGSISAWLQESADDSSWTSNDTAGDFSRATTPSASMTGLVTASKVYTFEVRDDQMTLGKRYVRLQIKEVNIGAALVAVQAIGFEGKQKPHNANNSASVVTQNVAV